MLGSNQREPAEGFDGAVSDTVISAFSSIASSTNPAVTRSSQASPDENDLAVVDCCALTTVSVLPLIAVTLTISKLAGVDSSASVA